MNRGSVTAAMLMIVVVVGFLGGLAQGATYNALVKDSMMKDSSAVPLSLWPFALSSSVVLTVTFMLMAGFRAANLV